MIIDVGGSDREGGGGRSRRVFASVLTNVVLVSVAGSSDNEQARLDQGIDGRVEDFGVTCSQGKIDDSAMIRGLKALLDHPIECSENLGQGACALTVEALDSNEIHLLGYAKCA